MNLTTAFTLAKFDLVKSYSYQTVPGQATPCTGTEGPLDLDLQVHLYSHPGAELVWLSYWHVHTNTRNRMSTELAKKLVKIYFNGSTVEKALKLDWE